MLNLYFVDAGDHQRKYYDEGGVIEVDDYRLIAYFAAETRGKAHAQAVREWHRDIDYTDPISIRKVGEIDYRGGIVDFDSFEANGGIVPQEWFRYEPDFAEWEPLESEATDDSK